MVLFAWLAVGGLVLPSKGLAAPGSEEARGGDHEIGGMEVFEVDFAESLPATIPVDPRRALNFPFLIEGPGLLSGLHLHLVADVESPEALSAIVVGPEGTTWALALETSIGQRPGKVDVWLDLLEEGTEFAREASHRPVKGTWTVQVFQLRPGLEGRLLGVEVILEAVSDVHSKEEGPASTLSPENEVGSEELETKKFALEAAAAAEDGCGGSSSGGCGCRMFGGETGWLPRGVLLGLVLGVILFLSLKGAGRRSVSVDDGGER